MKMNRFAQLTLALLLLIGPGMYTRPLHAQEPDPPEPPSREEMGIDLLIEELRLAEAALGLDPHNRDLVYRRVGALYLVGVQEKWAVEQGLAALDSLATVMAAESMMEMDATVPPDEVMPGDPVMQEDTALSLAYRGGLTTLLGKHAFWPHSKLSHVRSGLSMLDRAVEMKPASARIRYLRLMSGYYLPGIFGRGNEVRTDFVALANLLPDATAEFPPRLHAEVCRFVLEHGDLDEAQKDELRRALSTA